MILADKGCLECHSLEPNRDRIGPSLHARTMVVRIQNRLQSKEYHESVKKVDLIKKEPYLSYLVARKKILESRGLDQVRVWMRYHLLEPRFDNPSAQMPNLGLTEQEALALTDFLTQAEKTTFLEKLRLQVYKPKYKQVAAAFVGGIFFGLLIAWRIRLGPSSK